MDNTELTILDMEEMLIKKLENANDPKDIESLAAALAKVHNSIVTQERNLDELNLQNDIEERRLAQEKKKDRVTLTGIVITALATIAGACGAQYIKGRMDQEYQDQGYAHEKTEAVIWNMNKHKRR